MDRNDLFCEDMIDQVLNMSPRVSTISLILIISSFSLYPAIALTSNEGNDTDGLKTYIIYVEKPKQLQQQHQADDSREMDLDSWYRSFMPTAIRPNSVDGHDHDHQSRILYSYKNVFSGFAARLTAEEVKAMETKEGFISAHVENRLKLHTTHSQNFLGLHENSGFWKDSNMGKGVIIGVLDTGIAPDHPSFSDEGMPPPPAKWKGKCELQGVTCNNKVIGARNFLGDSGGSPLDIHGHGTHTASTAAGNFVKGVNFFGQANGTSVGTAPLAHLAIYRVCDLKDCPESKVEAAIDAAIDDGVDVLSLSFGSGSFPFHLDASSMGTFTAMQRGIFVSCSAGNSGPNPSTLSNEEPWVLTVGASTTDRSMAASTQLGNQEVYDGQTLVGSYFNFTSTQLPLVYPGDSAAFCLPEDLKSIDVKGKVVLCKSGGPSIYLQKGEAVRNAGGAGIIIINEEINGDYVTLYHPHVIPAVHVSHAAGDSIKAYISSTPSSTASITFKGTVIGRKSAPEVGRFSSRGPSKESPGILKPDIVGPGVSIMAAWPFSIENKTDTKSTFNIESGTSMACPHLSGVAALLKSAHPDWSPAAIKSAMMTTADITNLEGNPIIDYDLLPADLYAVGAGHVNPSRANDPGLVYDIQPDDYIPYLCALKYSGPQIKRIVDRDVDCSKLSNIAEAALNYPSFSIKLGSTPQTYNRTVTNVGQTSSSYTLQVVAPKGVEVSVRPDKITFTEKNQKATYAVTFTRNQGNETSFSQGYLSWSSGHIIVRSPIAITFE